VFYGGELWHHQLQTWIQHHQKERKGKKFVDEDMKLCCSILHVSQDLIITI
jgi:hypothetical protein